LFFRRGRFKWDNNFAGGGQGLWLKQVGKGEADGYCNSHRKGIPKQMALTDSEVTNFRSHTMTLK
jgi:hypothetical protein